MIESTFMLLSGAALISNVVALKTLVQKLKRSKNYSSHYIISLACSDLIFSLGIFTVHLIQITDINVSYNTLLVYWNISQGITFTSSLLFIFLVVVDP